jgi:hypothetical protein
MKRKLAGLVAGGLVVGALALAGAGTVFAGQTAPSSVAGWTMMSGSSYGGMMGSSGPGGMWGSGSGGMWGTCDPNTMMGNGGMMGSGGMMGGATTGTPLTLDQAQQSVQRFLDRYGNRTLVIDEVMEFQKNFYALVKDRSTGHGAVELLVNKYTGAVFPEYGPAMMWNTTYGMMSGMMGYRQPSGAMTVSTAQATHIAHQWLAQNQPGATTERPEQFPGYYTVHILRNGTVTGMLSVNGYSGQVWYHTWHGTFIRLKDLHA